MKKFLPKTLNNPKVYTEQSRSGFTLVELMVVISIIAILSVIGITVYTGTQKSARDAARRTDIEAIAKALEMNKTDIGYVSLANTQFASAGVPVLDPSGKPYCFRESPVIATFTNSAHWNTLVGGVYQCNSGYGAIAATGTPASGTISWIICASLENPSSVYCARNAQ